MNSERGVVYGVVLVVLVTTLASGPLVGVVDLTTAQERPAFGDGNATVEAVALPESAEITEGRYDSGEYYLRVPDASVELGAVTGHPLLAYEISIDELGYSRSTTHFISASNVGTYPLSLERDSLERSKITGDSYDATLSVVLRANDTERELGTRNITVEVTE